MFRRILVALLKFTACVVVLTASAICIVSLIFWIRRPSPSSAEGLLAKADTLAWNNNWAAALPYYGKAQRLFENKGDEGHALYAKVSQIPVTMESHDLAPLIAELNRDLTLSAARSPEIRLRILEIKGKCEEEYDASIAIQTFAAIEQLALNQHKLYLASRASGEQGILAFTLGNFENAATRVKRAYAVARYLGDPAGHIRFAGMIGLGLQQMGRPKQALVFLNEAISTQEIEPAVALPYLAINAKIASLSDLGRYSEALLLADHAIATLRERQYLGQLQALLTSRSDALMLSGKVDDSIAGYREALGYAHTLSAWRAVSNIDGKLASTYEREGNLAGALSAINDAIDANKRTPQEMFLVPGNLASKAKILAEMGRRAEAERLYAKGAEVIDLLLSGVPTPGVERLLLAQLGEFYSGYFRLLSDDGRLAEAFRIIEQAHGRIEAQQLEFDHTSIPQANDPVEMHLQQLELKILNDDDRQDNRAELLSQVNVSSADSSVRVRVDEPAPLQSVQKRLDKNELLVEYVLAEPSSYALVIGQSRVSRYVLPRKKEIEEEVETYRNGVLKHIDESKLARKLFQDTLGFSRNYPSSDSLVIVADGDLHLLPFSALIDSSGRYLVEVRTISMAPSGTVLHLLRTRAATAQRSRPYLGVAPWTDTKHEDHWILRTRGAVQASTYLPPLPQSRDEVESIAAMMPQPSTVLIGSQATKEKFESLPLPDYRILHLALHGIVDPVFPDRSSLVFAPSEGDDGRLQARDIRKLRLRAELVTLSACDTAVGPVSAAGIESLDTAFIEAGADSVVSSLWELNDNYANKFMKGFYGYLSHESKAAALRDAKLELLHAGAAPYYWASYELVGNPSGTPLGIANTAEAH